MLFSQLKSSLTEPKKVYLLEGEESFFHQKGIKLLKDKFVSESDFNFNEFLGSALKTNVDSLIGALSVCPLMSDFRLICVTEWYPTLSELKEKQLHEFFNSELSSTIMVISNKNKCEALKKQSAVEIVDCKRADLDLITKFLQVEAQRSNLSISFSNCSLMAEFCNYDMVKISTEMQKICSFLQEGSEITGSIINQYVTKDTDFKIYEIVNFISQKQFDKAYEVMNEMIDANNQQFLLVSLFSHFRRLLMVSISKDSDSKLAEQLQVKEYAIKKAKEQARFFPAKRLKKINEMLIDYDGKFKMGKIDLKQALDNAVFSIMTEN